LTKDLTIMGRQSSCDVQILDNMSSRAHCQIRRDGKLYSLVDLGSRNGTHLNDKKVSERQLVFGDRVRIGEAEYKFVKEPGDVELKDLLSKYEVQEKIGEGGMGIVYKANQKSMNRTVALKILLPKYLAKQRFVDQFIKEARAAGALNHPNIIQVHEVGTENDIHYFSMEYVEGATCMQILRDQGPFKIGEALEVIRQTAKALEYAHSQRLIHQDIKPDNIMIGQNNQVKLADLGISKTFDEVESEEGPKRVMGTPHYMAPEAALGKKIDHRVDIYALGATLYHLLTGKTPYSGTSATEVLKAHVMDPLPAIEDINPEVPEDVCALVERMVAKKADDRYQTAAEIVEEVVRLQQGHGLGTARISGGETMLLRRYVGGEKPGGDKGAHQTPAGTTNTRTPRASDLGATTSERVIGRGAAGGMIKGVVFSIIVLVLVIIGWQVLNTKTTELIPPKTSQPGTGSTTDPNPAPVEPQEDLNAKRIAGALTSLEERVKSAGETADLSPLLATIDELRAQKLTGENLTRAKLLHEKIGALIKQRHVKAVEQDFATLKVDVQKLLADHNYDLALKRLDAFAAKDDPAINGRPEVLRDDVTKARDSYLGSLKQKITFASSQRNLPKLKELRDQLPPALLGTDAETDITKAIQAIEDQQQAEQQTIVQSAGAALAKWDLSGVEDIGRSNRTAMGATANGRQLDAYVDAAAKLKVMMAAVSTQLQSVSRYPRYRGTLKGWIDPDLVGADTSGVQIQIATGGTASIKWSEMPADALQAIVRLVLPKDQAEAAAPAIDTWSGVKGGDKDKGGDANK
ncbi:MAG TPA: FHA domain-containing serine/threonine-protein kinase, partial [Planctomycetota bacterium]|nr:FHA domain-containing serine/threonine-protein kinase [Planctomycetota bacterium]